MKHRRRVAIVSIGFLESLLFSGCLFGWPTLLHVLQKEGVYSHLCPPSLNNTFPGTTTSSPIPENIPSTSAWTSSTERLRHTRSVSSGQGESSLLEDEVEMLNKMGMGGLEDDVEEEPSYGGDKPQRRHCNEQTLQMTFIYTVAAIAYGLTAILIGFLLDIVGLWITRLGGCLMTTAGFALLAFTSKEMSWLLWPALNLLALGTSQLRLSSFQFANLWPKYRNTILLLYSSAYSISTTVFLLIQFAYGSSIPFKTILLTFTIVSCTTIPVTFSMPKMRVEDHKDDDDDDGVVVSRTPAQQDKIIRNINSGDGNGNKNEGKNITKDETPFHSKISKLDDDDDENNIPRILRNNNKGGNHENLMNPFDETDVHEIHRRRKSDDVPLGTSLWTLSAGFHLFWHFTTYFLILFYSCTFLPWVLMTTDDHPTIEHYNKISGLCALIAPTFIPIAGLITDWQIKKAEEHEDKVERLALTMRAPAITKGIASLFILATMICKIFLTPTAIYISLIFIAMSRPFIVGSCTSYIRLRFHPSHFNRLNGIFTTVISVLCLLQFPILWWMKRSEANFFRVHIFLITLLLLSLSSPLHMMIKPLIRRYAKKQLKYRTDL